MHNIYPHTFDRDQIRVSFSDIEEKVAFEKAVEELQERVTAFRKSTPPIPKDTPIQNLPRIEDFKFSTTLIKTIAEEHTDDIRRIVGLHVFNDSDVIIPILSSKFQDGK